VKTHLIITSANIDENYEVRKGEYKDALNSYKPYLDMFDSVNVLETANGNTDYIEDYEVTYSVEPNVFVNKGMNEINHVHSFLSTQAYDSEDMIVKLTGRYPLTSDVLIKKVKEGKYDFVGKSNDDIYPQRKLDYHFFYFGMKVRRFINMFNDLQLNGNDKNCNLTIGIEKILYDFNVNKPHNFIFPTSDSMGVYAKIYYGGIQQEC